MDKELKTKWVEALRSGEYEQGRMSLRRLKNDGGYSYCCLGVLADITDNNAWEDKDRWNNEGGYFSNYMLDEFGITEKFQDAVMVMNDGNSKNKPKSFTEIANYIEEIL